MEYKRRKTYSSIVKSANNGNPHAMITLAKLNKAGAFGETDYSEYIFWLKQFFTNPKIDSIVRNLEAKYSGDQSSLEKAPLFYEEYELRDDIVYAGIALGVFYQGSSAIQELKLACNSFVAALDASGWDYIDCSEPNADQSTILDLLTKVRERMDALGYVEETDE